MGLLLLCMFGDTTYFQSKNLKNLPEWASYAVGGLKLEDAPKDARVWILSNEYLLGFDRSGFLLVRHRIVHAVMDQGGADAVSGYAENVSSDVGSVLHMTGWHVPNLGPMQKVDMDDAVTFGGSQPGAINRDNITSTGFEYVSKGSIVAFESVTLEKPYLGAIGAYPAVAAFPTRVLRIALVEENGDGDHVRLSPVNFDQWQIRMEKGINEFTAYDLPSIQNVPLAPQHLSFYPYVTAQFLASKEDLERYRDWDSYARWYWGVFKRAALEGEPPPAAVVTSEALRRICKPLQGSITYHQVYLTNARGFVPAKGSEVLSRAYGDCKDMASCFAYLGQTEKVRVLPVLANIVDGAFTNEKSPTYPMFNHLIAAVPLTESLGLPAEVTVNGRLYFIFDATSSDTSFGYLPDAYIGRSVLICSEKGADWATIPERAIEPGRLDWALRGKLDANQGFSGKILLREQGNASGYRTRIGRYDKSLATQSLRAQLPIMASLELVSANVDAEGVVVAEWNVVWPRFLRKAGPGYQLPEFVLPKLETELRFANRPREMPLFIEARPHTSWHLEIELERPVKVDSQTAELSVNGWHYKWAFQDGVRLNGNFELRLEQRAYQRLQVGTGVKDWLAFSQNYADFRREKTLLLVP